MRLSISSSDRKFIGTLLLWTVILGAAANLVAGYGLGHWRWLRQRAEMPKFEVAANIQNYLLDYRTCPIVILGSSVVGGLPPPGWERPDVCSITLVGQGSLLGLEIMARSEAAPQVLFVESSFGFRDAPADPIAAATDPLREALHAWLPLTTARGNWINALSKSRYPVPATLYRPSESWEEWRAMRKRYTDVYVSIYGHEVNDWGRNHLDENLKRTEELIADIERRGTKIIFFEAPLDPQLASLPVIALWAELMHAAFADHEWVMDPTGKYYLNDGMHFTPGSGKDFFDLLMAHVPAPSNSGNDVR
jgi:hypothetical protein